MKTTSGKDLPDRNGEGENELGDVPKTEPALSAVSLPAVGDAAAIAIAPPHTPFPWQREPEFPCLVHKGVLIATFQNEEDAEASVRACNSYNGLLENLQNLVGLSEMRGVSLHEYGSAIESAKEAIAYAIDTAKP